MGRKTNPIILRVGNITHNWDPKWFASRRIDFRNRLVDDLLIRRYFRKTLRNASIAKVEIARDQKETTLTIHTSRPAVVIGRSGSGIEKIQKDLRRVLKKQARIRINVQEIRNPDTDATAVATQIVDAIEKRMPYRRVLKQNIGRSMQAGALGVRIALAGRLNGADIARKEWLADGNVPLHTFRADISYADMTAFTTFGTIGVKVWINRGDLVLGEEEKPGERRRSATAQTPARRNRRPSLADRAASPPKTSA